MSMTVNTIDPLSDPRWREFVEWHPQASIFHHPSWLKSLRQTYRFTPIVFTTSPPGEALINGLVFCPVRSWITGKRLVSLPFSDHCDLLADSDESSGYLSAQIAKLLGHNFNYAEIRSTHPSNHLLQANWRSTNRFLRHYIDLKPSPDEIFRGFHKNCIQRKIRKAERDGLQYVSGHSESLLTHFYTLMLRTRRRHRIPPQPFRWFQNLLDCMGNRISIHMAFQEGRPAAAILTLTHQKTLTYKYGCSDERLNHLGGTPFLFWKAIQEAKSAGMETLDLGRSEVENQGLITFKQHLGAESAPLFYWTSSNRAPQTLHRNDVIHLAQRFIPTLPAPMLHLPRSILALPGTLLYRHMD